MMIIAKSAGRVLQIWVSYREVEQLQHPRITIIVLPAASGSKDSLIESELGWSQMYVYRLDVLNEIQ